MTSGNDILFVVLFLFAAALIEIMKNLLVIRYRERERVCFISRKIKQKIAIRFNSLVNNEKLEDYHKYSTENDFKLHEHEA